MKKIWKVTIGGLHHKILSVLLIFLGILIISGILMTTVQSSSLENTVDTARNDQIEAIRSISENTMDEMLKSSMTKSTALQAYIADDMFKNIKCDVLTLKSLAETYFEDENTAAAPFSAPDRSRDGEYVAQVLSEDGVDPSDSEYIGIAANMSNNMISMCNNIDYLNNCYIGLADGTHLCIDDNPSNKYDDNGDLYSFPVRERPWYKGAAEKGGLYFTGVEYDTFTDKIGIVCSAPIYKDGELVGVVGADLFLDEMADYVNSSTAEGGFICIVNDKGQIIFAPESNGLFTVMTSGEAPDLRDSGNAELAEFVNTALEKRTDLSLVTIDSKKYYMTGAPIETVGWAVIAVVDKEITEQPEKALMSDYEKINLASVRDFRSSSVRITRIVILVTVLILLVGIVAALKVADHIVKPIEAMTGEIMESGNSGKLFEMKDIYKTGDEIEVLAESFDDLSKKTRQYIDHITAITKEKERIHTELSLATQIQASMLPNVFPPYPQRDDFSIFASMAPAKEVGGDFYDFFLIDDDHLGMIIADVSGKGIPAALFMMASKILLENLALGGLEPSEVLTKANEHICKDNKTDMFVTVWCGILEISTGKVRAANAGHEYPVLKGESGRFEIVKDKHGFVIGGMEGMKYRQYEFEMGHGDTLFLYTDGVPEATNSENELFGTDRMLDALNDDPNADPRQVTCSVKNEIDKFVAGAQQFDDLTTLCVKRT